MLMLGTLHVLLHYTGHEEGEGEEEATK